MQMTHERQDAELVRARFEGDFGELVLSNGTVLEVAVHEERCKVGRYLAVECLTARLSDERWLAAHEGDVVALYDSREVQS